MRQVLQSGEEATIERFRIQETFQRGWAHPSIIQEDGGPSRRGKNGRPHSRKSSADSIAPRWNHLSEEAEEERERVTLIRMELALETARSLQVDLGVLGLNDEGVEQGLPTAGNPTDVSPLFTRRSRRT